MTFQDNGEELRTNIQRQECACNVRVSATACGFYVAFHREYDSVVARTIKAALLDIVQAYHAGSCFAFWSPSNTHSSARVATVQIQLNTHSAYGGTTVNVTRSHFPSQCCKCFSLFVFWQLVSLSSKLHFCCFLGFPASAHFPLMAMGLQSSVQSRQA